MVHSYRCVSSSDKVPKTDNSREFLKPRGLRLSAEKTRIVRIEQGFDFLGQHLQKYHNTLIITPSKDNTRSFLSKLRDTIRSCYGWKTEDMIKKLNPMIRGWVYYHRYVQSYGAFSFAERTIFQSLWRWIKRRYPQKSCGWIIKHYFNNLKHKWVFSCWIKDRSEKKRLLELIKPFLRQAQNKLS